MYSNTGQWARLFPCGTPSSTEPCVYLSIYLFACTDCAQRLVAYKLHFYLWVNEAASCSLLVSLLLSQSPSRITSQRDLSRMADEKLTEQLCNLDFIVNHVYFPPKLPQKHDIDSTRNFALCKLLVELAAEV